MFREAVMLLRRSRGERVTSLQLRVAAFFSLFAVFLVGLCFLALMLTGVFNAAENESRAWLNAEMAHFSDNVSADYSRLSLRGVSLAKTIASDVGAWAQSNGIKEAEIAAYPELLEDLLAEQTGILLAALENNQCSGVFIILDATVNPAAENAADSRAGLFFHRTEPNNVTTLASKITCLRGPASVARANGIELMGQWRMEFDTGGMGFYEKSLNTARGNTDLSRLYYWSERHLLDGNSENAMLLCVPLIARDGAVYGICGIEVSSMLFKRLYSPNNAEYPHVFSALAPVSGGALDTEAGLVAGNSYLTSQTTGALTGEGERAGVVSYRMEDGGVYVGRSETLRLYPTGSPYENETWALALLMPESDWNAAVSGSNVILYEIVILLLAVSLVSAIIISRRYIRPMVTALELIRTDNPKDLPKTRIAEIDDLLEYLAALDGERSALGEEVESLTAELEQARRQPAARDEAAPNLTDYAQFLENLKTLTATERAVFNLYTEGRTARQISDALFITDNTVKFHNKNIYKKLGVSSLKALRVFINMMREMRDGE